MFDSDYFLLDYVLRGTMVAFFFTLNKFTFRPVYRKVKRKPLNFLRKSENSPTTTITT